MEFWIIQAQENPPAPRTEPVRREWRSNTLAETLADRGHAAVRWRSSFSHQAKVQLATGSVRVATENYHHQYIDAPGYRSHVGLARVLSHRALSRNFLDVARAYPTSPDLIHVSNVPIDLCHAAVCFGQEMDVPVIVDIRDLWPDIYADLLPNALSVMREPLRGWLTGRKGRLGAALAGATGITGLTQPYLDWGLAKAGRAQGPNDSVFSMCYPKPKAPPSQDTIDGLRERVGIGANDVLACYIGNIGYQSDFEGLIASADYLADSNPGFKIVLAGSGPALDGLKSLARGTPNVFLPGWLQAHEVHALMHISTFGLIAYKPVPNFLMNVPNKFAEYLAGGLVIACSLNGEMGRLVDENHCGFVYDMGDPRALAERFTTMLDDPEMLQTMSQNAAALHHDEFEGSIVHEKFADYLVDIAQGRPTAKDTKQRA